MAKLEIYRTSGKIEVKEQESRFSLEEAREMIGGYIQVIPLLEKRIMLVDEEGLPKQLPINMKATKTLQATCQLPTRAIVGDVIVCTRKDIML